jgi:hypothetical protein
MTKQEVTSEVTGTLPAQNDNIGIIKQPYLLLKSATAKKLGKQAEGGIHYQILADLERQGLYITITGNDGGGYFSREVVPLRNVEDCVAKCESGTPFPSKLFQPAFTGRSTNNPSFLAAVLRAEALLALAPETEGRHLIAGDWNQWKQALLAEPGTQTEIGGTSAASQQTVTNAASDHTEHTKTKTLSVSRRKKT